MSHTEVKVRRTMSDDIVLQILEDGQVKEQTTLSCSEVIYLIADILALWRALPLLVPVGNYLEEICDFWEGVCEPVIHYLI
jgi:hypothetical protein